MEEKIIIKYDIAVGEYDIFHSDINKKIKNGWQPYGSLSFEWDNEEQVYYYLQAIVIYQ